MQCTAAPVFHAICALQVVDKYGADALRLYLVNSPVVRAEPLRFEEAGVFGVVKDVFLPWYNAYRFLCQNVVRLAQEGRAFKPAQVLEQRQASNVLDRWILAATRRLVSTVRCSSISIVSDNSSMFFYIRKGAVGRPPIGK